jgi:hypothetical protein
LPLLARYLLWPVRSIPVSKIQLELEYFGQWGYLPLLAGHLLWQVRTVPVGKMKLQLGLIFGIRIRIGFYLFKNWTQNQNSFLWEKNLIRKEVNYQLTTGFWSELVRTRSKLGLIFKTKTRIELNPEPDIAAGHWNL